MTNIFLTVLNMTFTATFVIAAIILVRLFLKKTPKIISYILWIAAGFRLVFPFSIESILSLIPFKSQPIPQDIVTQTVPRIDTGINFVDNAVSNILPAASPAPVITPQDIVTIAESVNPLQVWTFIGASVWIAGIAVMLIYSVVSIILLKCRLDDSVHIEGNLYEAANIKTPFVLGIFKPKIYIPANLTDSEKEYIILHERTHIKRGDNIIKFFAYFILSLHWFNPFAWAAFILMSSDMEMSCDEKVLKKLGGETKKAYSLSLLSLASEKRIINSSPLAFGEGDTKRRINNVLKFKKHSRIIMIIAVIAVAALTIGFTLNRVNSETPVEESEQTAWEALTTLKNSIIYTDGGLSFIIPADYPNPSDWIIWISGRAEYEDGFSTSLHFFNEESENRSWEAGKQYGILVNSNYTELVMTAFLPDENGKLIEIEIDLLEIAALSISDEDIIQSSVYIVSDIGFRVSLPASWNDKFYPLDLDGVNGFIVVHKATYDINPNMGELFRVTRHEGVLSDEEVMSWAGNTIGFSGDNYYILFTVPTDVQYIPGESSGDEYLELAAQIDEIKRGIAVSIKETSQENNSADFNVQIFRTNLFEDTNLNYATVLTSRFILERYYEGACPNAYYPEKNVDEYAVLFWNGIEKYTDSFFEENFLMIILVHEPSGSIRHEVEQVDKNDIIINRLLPGNDTPMTGDMAEWHIIIELSRDFMEPELKAEPFNVIFQNKVIS